MSERLSEGFENATIMLVIEVPPKYEERAKARIKNVLKDFQERDVINWAEQQGLNESDTRSLVEEVLSNALGYEKLREITREFEVKGRYADFAIKIDGKLKLFIEVKSIGSKLNEKDLFQVLSYSASYNLPWMILTNGRIWRCYHLSSGTPPQLELVFEVDLLVPTRELTEVIEKLYLLSKEAMWRDQLSDYWERAKASSPEIVTKCLFSENVVTELKREIYRVTKQRVTPDTLVKVLATQVLRGNLVEQVADQVKRYRKTSVQEKHKKKKRQLPASCFAYVPDPDKPTTWKLRYRNPDGSVDEKHLYAAVASLSPGGFRGRRVEIPDEHLPQVKEKLRQAYAELGKEIPQGLQS